jgi:hypothetical protein
MPLSWELKEAALLLEIELERSLLSPVSEVLSQLQSGDIIVSDMYHDTDFFEDSLHWFAPNISPAAFLVSGHEGMSKASGRLWKRVRELFPDVELHIGDNNDSDVRQAIRHGIAAARFDGAKLNRYETALVSQDKDGSIMAGVSRATRLSLVRSDSSESDAATIEVFASVIGPLLYSFCRWILSACEAENIHDVCFLARDGQLPYRICSRLVAEGNLNLRCHYIYASRQALHLPGCKSIDDAESWLLEDTPFLSLRTISERSGVSLDVLIESARHHLSVFPDQNIPKEWRSVLTRVIRTASFVSAFLASVDTAFISAATYYRASALASSSKVAIVDVGWNGRMQHSLGSLLQKMGRKPETLLGLYLCLRRRQSSPDFGTLLGFLCDPERPALAVFFDRYRNVLEASLSADHPTTMGFSLVDGRAVPLLGEPYPACTKHKVDLQHATLNSFIDNILKVANAAGRPIQSSDTCIARNFRNYLCQPSRTDGLAFNDFLFVDGQSGSSTRAVSKTVGFLDLLRRRGDPRRDLGYWTEGTLSGSNLCVLAKIRRRFKHTLKRIDN